MGSEAGSTDKEGFGKKGCALVGLPSISTLDALSRRMKTELFEQVSHECMHHRSAKNEQVIVFKEYCQKSEWQRSGEDDDGGGGQPRHSMCLETNVCLYG